MGNPPRALRQRRREGELRVPLLPLRLLPLFNLGRVPIKLGGTVVLLVEPLGAFISRELELLAPLPRSLRLEGLLPLLGRLLSHLFPFFKR